MGIGFASTRDLVSFLRHERSDCESAGCAAVRDGRSGALGDRLRPFAERPLHQGFRLPRLQRRRETSASCSKASCRSISGFAARMTSTHRSAMPSRSTPAHLRRRPVPAHLRHGRRPDQQEARRLARALHRAESVPEGHAHGLRHRSLARRQCAGRSPMRPARKTSRYRTTCACTISAEHAAQPIRQTGSRHLQEPTATSIRASRPYARCWSRCRRG